MIQKGKGSPIAPKVVREWQVLCLPIFGYAIYLHTNDTDELTCEEYIIFQIFHFPVATSLL